MSERRVLFVDDELGVLRAVGRLFRKADFKVLTASCAEDGLALLDTQQIQVVFSDQRMPGMRGTDFLKIVRERFPATVRCIMSGYAEMESVVAAINHGNVYRFVSKPWEDEELTSVICECLAMADAIVAEKNAVDRLALRTSELEDQKARQDELLHLKDLLLKSSRDVLEQLPIAIAALDPEGRLIFVNREFTGQFGHRSDLMLGEVANETWQTIARNTNSVDLNFTVDSTQYSAHVAHIEIGGQPHALIAAVATTNMNRGN
jgi:response regulator RpfG family c-di-GMP phosphodiesterase